MEQSGGIECGSAKMSVLNTTKASQCNGERSYKCSPTVGNVRGSVHVTLQDFISLIAIFYIQAQV